MSVTTEHPRSSPTLPERRQHPRRKIYDTCYIDLLDGANGGLVLNISETGLQLQSALKVSDKVISRLRFQLPSSDRCIEACAKLVWVGESGKAAGAQFLDLPEEALAGIKEWIANGGLSASASVPLLASSPPRRPAAPTCSTLSSQWIPRPQPISRTAFPGSTATRSGTRRLLTWLSEPICFTRSALSVPRPLPISRLAFPGSRAIRPGMRRLLAWSSESFHVSFMNRMKRSLHTARFIYEVYGRPIQRRPTAPFVRTDIEGGERGQTIVAREGVPSAKAFVDPSPTTGEANETVKETIYRDVCLNPKRGSFDGDAVDWSFRRGNEIIVATIIDKEFLRKCMTGEYRLNHADLLIVELLQRQRVVGTEVMKPSYEITKVTSYVRGAQQQKIDSMT